MGDAPHIELYMYSLNQEFPAGKGHATFLKRRSELKVDEKSGALYSMHEVEQQVYYTGERRDGHIASREVPIDPLIDNSATEISGASIAVPWTAQWAQNGWVAQWLQNADYTNTCEPFYAAAFSDPLANVKVREEDFGGILYNPISDMVYKVNRTGLALFREIQQAHLSRQQDLRHFSSSSFDHADVTRFLEYLRDEMIWQPRR